MPDNVDLDETPADGLPPERVRRLHCLHGVDRSASIVVHQLLGHCTGLADWLEDRPTGARSLVQEVLQHGDRAVSFDEAHDHVRRRRLRPHHAPADTPPPVELRA